MIAVAQAFFRPSPLIDDAAVFDAATAIDALQAAWNKVWSNQGCSGGDGVTLERFQRDGFRLLARLSADLKGGTYAPSPPRRVDIPKKSGGVRTLTIPSVRDRIAQTAVAAALGPLLEREFEESSFAYRPGRSVDQAVARLEALHREGATHVVDADITAFFDRVPHDKLLARLGESMSDGPLTRLIGLWLAQGSENGRGIAQGSPLSPLLANLFLDRLDEAFAAKGARIVRFADDFVIACAGQGGAEGALAKAKRLLAEQGLELNPDKTRVVSFDQGFGFLGNLFVKSLVLRARGDEEDETNRLLRLVAADDGRAEEERREAEDELERQRRGGLEPGLRVLYVMEPGRRLTIRNQAFAVEEAQAGPDGGEPEWTELLALPHQAVDRIDLGPRGEATPEALRHALATDTTLAFVNGHGETLGWLAPRFGPRAGRHLAQAAHALDPAKRIVLARAFVAGRARNQRALLSRLDRRRRDPEVVKALAELTRLIPAIEREDDPARLMGLEGRAAALYWPAFGRVLNPDFPFARREREGPIGAVNIMLNMTASLLTRDVTAALELAGLHPGFGMLHASADHHDAAAWDLMEEFRAPLAESAVATAVNNREVALRQFVKREDGGFRMEGEATRAVIRAYERAVARLVKSGRDGRRRTWRQIMVEQARLLGQHCEGRAEYRPYVIDY